MNFGKVSVRYLYNEYNITKETYMEMNGDEASWIRTGVDGFENAIYVYDYYHEKKRY